MRIWRAHYGCDNGCNGEGVRYFATKREAKKVLSRHDKTMEGHAKPCVTMIDVPPIKAAMIKFLNDETLPLCTQ
jgi:hypothetical protein